MSVEMARAALRLASAISSRDTEDGLRSACAALGGDPGLVLYRSLADRRGYEMVARAGGPIGVPLWVPWGSWGPADRARATGDPGTGGPHPFGSTQRAFLAGPASQPPGNGLGLALLLPPGHAAPLDLDFLQVLAEAAEYGEARSAQFSDLARRSLRDPLTGVLNRKALEEVLVREMKRASRPDNLKQTSLLMLDLDGFKEANDRYGHLAGDRLLKAVAEAMARTLRIEDVVARYGGDEFAILLPETSAEASLRVAEKIREVVARVRVNRGEAAMKVTVSIGACTDTGEAATFDHAPSEEEKRALAQRFAHRIRQLLSGADSALYAAKALGRNIVRHHDPLPCPGTALSRAREILGEDAPGYLVRQGAAVVPVAEG